MESKMGFGRLKDIVRSYYFLYGLIVVLSIISALIMVAHGTLKNIYINNNIIMLKNTLSVVKSGIAHHIQDRMQITKEMASDPYLIDFIQRKINKEQLKNKLEFIKNPYMIFSPEKQLLFSFRSSARISQDTALHTALENSFILFEPIVSDFILDSDTGMHHIFISAPIMDEKRLKGFFVIELNTKDLQEVVSRGYERIGESGDIVIGEKKGDAAVVVLPTRFDPQAAFNTKVSFGALNSLPLQESVRGGSGILTGLDLNLIQSIFTWDYIPVVGWGIVVKQKMKEIHRSLIWINIVFGIMLVLCLIGILACLYRFLSRVESKRFLVFILTRTLAIIVYLFFIINIVSLAFFLYRSYQRIHIERIKENTEISVSLQNAAQRVNYIFSHLEGIAQLVGHQLKKQSESPDMISRYLEHTLKQNVHLNTVSVLFNKHDTEKWNVLSLQKDEKGFIAPHRSQRDGDWITQAATQSLGWELPYADDDNDFVYTMPIYKDNSQMIGLVVLTCTKSMIIQELDDALEQKIAFCLITSDGKVIYKQSGVPLKSFEINPQLPHLKMQFAKISDILWYVGGISQKKSVYWSFLMHILLTLVGYLLAIGSIVWALHAVIQATQDSQTRRGWMVFVLLLTIAVNLFWQF